MAALDAAALALGGILSVAAGEQAGVPQARPGWTAWFCGLVLLILVARGAHRFRVRVSPLDQLGQVIVATSLAAGITLVVRVAVTDDAELAARIVRTWFFATAFLVFGRVAAAIFQLRPQRPQLRTLIVGAGDVGHTVARHLRERPEWGLEPIGYLDKEPREGGDDLPVLGASWQLEEVIRDRGVDRVIVAFSTAPVPVLLSMIRRCRAAGVEVSVVPRLFEETSDRIALERIGGLPLLRVDMTDPRGWQFSIKYAIDRVVGTVAVVLLSPLLAVLALLVRVSSPGPILFRQPRVGLDGREFDILKFRTMRHEPDAPEADSGWAAQAVGAGAAAAPVDRTTRIGEVLRRFSLDELAQLVNIARGDMSIVGPRPERVGYVAEFEGRVYRYGDRHRVKSGLTGWAQVHGLRGETSLRDRVDWDNFYVENWSPWLDLKILLLTPAAVLRGTPKA
jgi:exopolysaccharide biosynthesis polyprenyl glycosylphosphotransferase